MYICNTPSSKVANRAAGLSGRIGQGNVVENT